jgi:hypothetical protein
VGLDVASHADGACFPDWNRIRFGLDYESCRQFHAEIVSETSASGVPFMNTRRPEKTEQKVPEPSPKKPRRFRVIKLEERIAPSTTTKAAQELSGIHAVNTDTGPIVFGGC